MSSRTKLRSAIEGWPLPSKSRPFFWIQTDSILARDAKRTFSASAAACGFKVNPKAGARTVSKIYPAERKHKQCFKKLLETAKEWDIKLSTKSSN